MVHRCFILGMALVLEWYTAVSITRVYNHNFVILSVCSLRWWTRHRRWCNLSCSLAPPRHRKHLQQAPASRQPWWRHQQQQVSRRQHSRSSQWECSKCRRWACSNRCACVGGCSAWLTAAYVVTTCSACEHVYIQLVLVHYSFNICFVALNETICFSLYAVLCCHIVDVDLATNLQNTRWQHSIIAQTKIVFWVFQIDSNS